jgi:hypothetical protein
VNRKHSLPDHSIMFKTFGGVGGVTTSLMLPVSSYLIIMNKIHCNKCGSTVEEAYYQKWVNGAVHLLGHCLKCGWIHLPFISGFNIPYTEKKVKELKKRPMVFDNQKLRLF